jgi:hypothetical protein
MGVGATIRGGLWAWITRNEEFVSSRLPKNYPREVNPPFSHVSVFFLGPCIQFATKKKHCSKAMRSFKK